jgi:predicted RNA binding protein YcfA (HicA-like mRNA interferase family)
MTTMSTDNSLDFLADLANDGLHEIRRELFRQLDETLLNALNAAFPKVIVPTLAEPTPKSDADVEESGTLSASRRGRSPQFTSARLIRDLRRIGLVRRKSSGGHQIFVHPVKRRGHVAVPHHPGDLPRGTLTNIVRQAEQVLGAKLTVDPRRSRLLVVHQ